MTEIQFLESMQNIILIDIFKLIGSNFQVFIFPLQLLLKKGSMHEALFRESDDPIKLQVFAERIEPYLDNPFYKVVIIILILRDEMISLLFYSFFD